MSMYLLLLGYFVLGGGGMLLYTQQQPQATKKSLWTKFGVYFLIVYGFVLSISHAFLLYKLIAVLICVLGFWEITQIGTTNSKRSVACLFFALLAFGFLWFSWRNPGRICATYLTVLTMDGFSQIIGQLLGKHKLWSKVSPSKTIEGTLGGMACGVLTYLFMASFSFSSFLVGLLIVTTALVGDLLASFYKRSNQAKDFSQLIPGHGGVLDRFDSFVFTGFVLFLLTL